MENDSASYTVLYKCWIFCRFLSVFYNSSWTLLFYWKRARNLASAESAFPPPTSFSSLHTLNAYRLKAKSASWILWIMIYFRPIWTHTLFKELLLLPPCCIHPLHSPPNKETEEFFCPNFLWALFIVSISYCFSPLYFVSTQKFILGTGNIILNWQQAYMIKKKSSPFLTPAAEFISPFVWWSSLAERYWVQWSSIKSYSCFTWKVTFAISSVRPISSMVTSQKEKEKREQRFCKNLADKPRNIKALSYQDRK